jgi:hypothetical protein
MNPWVAGRIVEQIHVEAQKNAHREHQMHRATAQPRRERLGLAVARVGLRIAGRRADRVTVARRFSAPHLEASH